MCKIDNRGSVALEATLVLPLFIFGMLAIYHMGQANMAEATIYEAAAETAEYMAEYSYIAEANYVIPIMIFEDYVDDEELIETYIDGGTTGINFWGTEFLDENNNVVLKVNYVVELNLPFLPVLKKTKTVTINKRAYVGFKDTTEENAVDADNRMVFIAENESVYHLNSECTHLDISVYMQGKDVAMEDGYTACELCGDECLETVYLTSEGERYHSTSSCSGLKRSVYQVPLVDVEGLGCCERCGN